MRRKCFMSLARNACAKQIKLRIVEDTESLCEESPQPLGLPPRMQNAVVETGSLLALNA